MAVGGNVSGVDGLAEIRSGKFLSGKSTSEEIDAAIELQCIAELCRSFDFRK